MAKTKTTPNPPPSVDYKTLYHWAFYELLTETSKITSYKDVTSYKESESDEKFRIFGREHDAYVSVRPCREGKPVCVDDRASPKEPFFFMYSTVFKWIKLRFRFTGFTRSLQNLTWPLPSCTPTTWPSLGPLPSCATISAIRPQWTSSCTSSRRRILARDCV